MKSKCENTIVIGRSQNKRLDCDKKVSSSFNTCQSHKIEIEKTTVKTLNMLGVF